VIRSIQPRLTVFQTWAQIRSLREHTFWGVAMSAILLREPCGMLISRRPLLTLSLWASLRSAPQSLRISHQPSPATHAHAINSVPMCSFNPVHVSSGRSPDTTSRLRYWSNRSLSLTSTVVLLRGNCNEHLESVQNHCDRKGGILTPLNRRFPSSWSVRRYLTQRPDRLYSSA
jgi:hypothetical protein